MLFFARLLTISANLSKLFCLKIENNDENKEISPENLNQSDLSTKTEVTNTTSNENLQESKPEAAIVNDIKDDENNVKKGMLDKKTGKLGDLYIIINYVNYNLDNNYTEKAEVPIYDTISPYVLIEKL